MAGNRIRYLWRDRRRVCGLPLSFTRYRLSEDRLFVLTGLLNLREEEVPLYLVRDLELRIGLFQRLFGVGTVRVISGDATAPRLDLKNVRAPREVRELLHRCAEEAKRRRMVRTAELNGGFPDANGNGIPDYLE